jgi:hypothetical protein
MYEALFPERWGLELEVALDAQDRQLTSLSN